MSKTIILDLTYRDGANYKTHFTHQVDLIQFPDVLTLEPESSIEMGQYGTASEEEFFNSEIHPYPYDENDDHNILTVNEVIV